MRKFGLWAIFLIGIAGIVTFYLEVASAWTKADAAAYITGSGLALAALMYVFDFVFKRR